MELDVIRIVGDACMHCMLQYLVSLSLCTCSSVNVCQLLPSVRPSGVDQKKEAKNSIPAVCVCVFTIYIYKERDTHKQIECCTYDASTSNIYTKYVCNDESYDE